MSDTDNIRKINKTFSIAVIGGILVLVILVAGTIWMGHSARRDNEEAVRTVSLLYLDELAGRREQVVESNLEDKIFDLNTAVGLMGEEDLSDIEHMQAYQARMKQLYKLEKFAFVDEEGLIYTALGPQDNIDDYSLIICRLVDRRYLFSIWIVRRRRLLLQFRLISLLMASILLSALWKSIWQRCFLAYQ